MKKFFYIAALLLIALAAGATGAKAQNYVITNSDEQVVVSNRDGADILSVQPDEAKPENISIRVAGYEISLNTLKVTKPHRHHNYYGRNIRLFEMGMSTFLGVDYADYAGAGEFMDLRIGKSLEVNWQVLSYTARLTRNGRLTLLTGLQLSWNNYVFANKIALENDVNGAVQPTDIATTTSKSKLAIFALRAPIELQFALTHRWFVAAGVFGGVNCDSWVKYKYPVNKYDISGLNPFYWGLTARIGGNSLYAFGNYTFTPIFRDSKGPEAHTLTIGLGIGF